MAKTFVCSGAESSGNISNFKGSVGRSVLISKAKAANISHDVRPLSDRTSLGRFTRRNGSVLPDGALWPLGKQQDPQKIAQISPGHLTVVLNLTQQRVQESITVRHYSRKPVRP